VPTFAITELCMTGCRTTYLKECGCLISRNIRVWTRKPDPIHDFLREVRFVNPESDFLVYRMLLTKTTLLTGGF
jgi:hypothetical protein